MQDGGGALWLILTVGGVILLGLVLAYTTMRNRKIRPTEHAATEAATADLYKAAAAEPENR